MKTTITTSRRWRAAAHLGLFATVIALAGFDWFVSPTNADDDNRVRNAIDAPRPTVVAPARDLTAPSAGSVRIGNVECRIVRTAAGYQLHAHNPGRRAEAVRVSVQRVEMSGESYGRMGPMPSVVATDTLALVLAPGGRTVRTLANGPTARATAGAQVAPAAPATGNQAPMVLTLLGGGYRTVDFRITEVGQPAATARVVRFADRATPNGVVVPTTVAM